MFKRVLRLLGGVRIRVTLAALLAVAAALARVNARLSVTERIRHHVLVPAFTIEEGLVTPSQKVRRREVIRRYRHLLA